MEYTLNPCRVCGGTPEINKDGYNARVRCPVCKTATGLHEAFEGEEEDTVAIDRAVSAWNEANPEVEE
jgi:uncharacterized Zn finger protein (UPF0148 family)